MVYLQQFKNIYNYSVKNKVQPQKLGLCVKSNKKQSGIIFKQFAFNKSM